MATKEIISKCNGLLKLMRSANEDKWTDDHDLFYGQAMAKWEDALCLRAATWCADNLQWRPSRAELRTVAARIASPFPAAADCYTEIIHWAQKRGLNGRQHPENPNVFIQGAPDGMHPITYRHIAALGGWGYVCSGEANLEGGIRKAIHGQHEAMAEEWTREVSAQLELPADKRNPKFFPAWTMPQVQTEELEQIERLPRYQAITAGEAREFLKDAQFVPKALEGVRSGIQP